MHLGGSQIPEVSVNSCVPIDANKYFFTSVFTTSDFSSIQKRNSNPDRLSPNLDLEISAMF